MPQTLAEKFQALWNGDNSPPNVFAFLEQNDGLDRKAQLAILQIDQQHRWKTDQPLKVEDYLARLPGLAVDSRCKLELAVGEFQARQNGSTSPSIEEFLSRFSDISDTLRQKLSDSETSKLEVTPPQGVVPTETFDSTQFVQRIGRYRILRVLGEGAFGRVLLAFDGELERQVAVKIPKPERFQSAEDAELYLTEARMVAGLDHPNIVPVHDVGRTDDGAIYVVSKFIEGSDLKTVIEQNRPAADEAAKLLAVVAEALHHAHQKRLIHRDIKPANILIEEATGTAYVADFGLAIREEDYLKSGNMAGTPAYMSPEQARGEGHRLDGRSDIFSVGIVFYELLTGKRPFRGSSSYELMVQISTVDPQPPRERDASIPAELQRICLKALAKRVSDRYATAAGLADDLLHWNDTPQQEHKDLQIVPKGLRSFDAEDADFFLDLLPGPRNREGLPESIAFWKSRIEEADPDKTFSVGLIYGPSGCGKSSLVKAGLLPRLSKSVITVYIEATPDETEIRILRGLRKSLPDLPHDLELVETFQQLRRDAARKVIVILDQFEQWLHAHRAEDDTELVNAVRQCDGGNLQVVVMVRDDFWLAASRFMGELDVELVQGKNIALVDLFEVDHAEKVLIKFGQAFGKLPVVTGKLTDEERAFVSAVAEGLAQDGKVVSVRLALFAEMVKSKPWVPATLEEVGGTEGIGVNFLEETFVARTANPKHRLHQQSAREVLKNLLPAAGSDIKGHMRSHAELLEASGYENRPKDFEELLRILDGELRLITPTDPEGFQTESGSDPDAKYYQLTHDYLVPSLREWLTRKQQETKKGRAELRLAERSALWNAKPENRHLPSWWEWAKIRTLTEKSKWTELEQRMMARAGRVHGVRGSLLLLLVCVLTFAGLYVRGRVVEANNREKAAGLVKALVNAEIEQVPGIIDELKTYRQWADPLLAEQLEEYGDQSKERLNLTLASLPYDDAERTYLKDRLLNAAPDQVQTICLLLEQDKETLLEDLWSLAEKTSQGEEGQLLNIACFLAVHDADNARWEIIADRVVEKLVQENSLRAAVWMKTLRPARRQLVKPLSVVFRSKTEERSQTQIDLATDVLEDYAAEDLETLAELLFDAEPKQFVALYDEFAAHGNQALELLDRELAKEPIHGWNDSALDSDWTTPTAAITEKIQKAHGMVAERFTFCQTMPFDEFQQVADALRKSGYRPIRLRPYAHNGSVQVAAAWTRDGRDWRMATNQTAIEIQENDEKQRAEGFVAVDVAGYLGKADEEPAELYACVWAKKADDTEDARIYAGATSTDHKSVYGALQEQGFKFLNSCQRFQGLDVEPKYCSVRTNAGSSGLSGNWDYTTEKFEDTEYLDKIHWDIDVFQAPSPQTTQERYEKELADAVAGLQEKPDDLNGRYARGKALFYLGRDEQSLEDMDDLIEKSPKVSGAYLYRAILHARMSHAEEAKQDLAKFQGLSDSVSSRAYLDAVVSTYLGEDIEAMKRLEKAVEENITERTGTVIVAARAYSVASQIFEEKDAAKSKVYADRAIALIEKAIENGYRNYSYIQENADLDPIREKSEFQKIMQAGNLAVRYVAAWHSDPTLESQEYHGLSPIEHLKKCKKLKAQGYRMVSLSTASINGDLVTASVWHRPVIPEMEKETLARRQANAAVAAVRMGQAEKVWPLLKHSPDPRLRTWIIHRLNPEGASPQAIVKRLGEEPEVSIRRALVLALGEYNEHPAIDREMLTSLFLDWYRHDPDAGIHGATEWVLRRWGQQNELEAVDAELATGKTEGKRRWYLTKTNHHTMTLFPGPVEFSMGSPETEAGRVSNESRHSRKIGRSFALATKEVTVAQFRQFTKESGIAFSFTEKYAPEEDCPQTSLSWYQAAQYCRWLSEQEGIPEDQMCYPPIPEIKDGMILPNNFLERTGYRLPTEAEWEYACRGGTTTSRFYGMADELLTDYAWFIDNAENRSWPVGSLKPSDGGLFDLYGNVYEWSNSAYKSYATGQLSEDTETGSNIEDKTRRVLRGGSFLGQSSTVRSALRIYYLPVFRNLYGGFRPARTYN